MNQRFDHNRPNPSDLQPGKVEEQHLITSEEFLATRVTVPDVSAELLFALFSYYQIPLTLDATQNIITALAGRRVVTSDDLEIELAAPSDFRCESYYQLEMSDSHLSSSVCFAVRGVPYCIDSCIRLTTGGDLRASAPPVALTVDIVPDSAVAPIEYDDVWQAFKEILSVLEIEELPERTIYEPLHSGGDSIQIEHAGVVIGGVKMPTFQSQPESREIDASVLEAEFVPRKIVFEDLDSDLIDGIVAALHPELSLEQVALFRPLISRLCEHDFQEPTEKPSLTEFRDLILELVFHGVSTSLKVGPDYLFYRCDTMRDQPLEADFILRDTQSLLVTSSSSPYGEERVAFTIKDGKFRCEVAWPFPAYFNRECSVAIQDKIAGFLAAVTRSGVGEIALGLSQTVADANQPSDEEFGAQILKLEVRGRQILMELSTYATSSESWDDEVERSDDDE